MKKIPTIFKRNPKNRRELLNEINLECAWVFNLEGVATRMYDGTCVKIEDNKYFKKREVKPGKVIPEGFIQENFDINTGGKIGWIEVNPVLKENKYHMEAYDDYMANRRFFNGTCELIGPKIQGNPEKCKKHCLIPHWAAQMYHDILMRDFNGLKDWFKGKDIEGIVFHHEDGRMAKIKKKDFGMKRTD